MAELDTQCSLGIGLGRTHEAGEGLFLFVAPEAKAAMRDAACRFDGRRFGDDETCAGKGEAA